MTPAAVVMNMFYTGLGIARSLSAFGVPVIGLTSQRRIYGNYTRHATVRHCPDSREDPQALLDYLLNLAKELGHTPLIFPTRDDDLLFLDEHREILSQHFTLVVPESEALSACLDKRQTYLWAQRAKVAAPPCCVVGSEQDLFEAAREVGFPCVLKPLSSHVWRKGGNWGVVGARKAIPVYSEEQLVSEYAQISHADPNALLQRMVPGGDDSLLIAACYIDRESNWVAGFNTQKLVQSPAGFGTGCVVKAADRPELIAPTARLLNAMRFTGIAEVEYKWDAADAEYKLIEVNPRPWDQHRLGHSCGIDLIYLAYCDHAGLPRPILRRRPSECKWIAEDAFATTALRLLWRRDSNLRALFGVAKGKRIYAIWSATDPLPLIAYVFLRFLPELLLAGTRMLWSDLKRIVGNRFFFRNKAMAYERDL